MANHYPQNKIWRNTSTQFMKATKITNVNFVANHFPTDKIWRNTSTKFMKGCLKYRETMYSYIIPHIVLNTNINTLHSTSKFSTVSVERNVGYGYSQGEFISLYIKSATQCFHFDQKKHPKYIQCKDVASRDFGSFFIYLLTSVL